MRSVVFYHDTRYSERVIYYKFSFVWYSVKQGTMHRPTSHLAHCALSWGVRRTQMAEQLCWFCWPLFVAACSEAGCCCCSSSFSSSSPSPPQNSLLTLLAFAPDSEAMSATEFQWWLPPQVLFIFSQPLLKTQNLLPSLDCCVWLSTVSEM